MVNKNYSNREKSWMCVEFWIRKGYSEEDAKKEISKRQSRGRQHFKTDEDYQQYRKRLKESKNTTEFKKKQSIKSKNINTIDYWIKKYGEIDGKERFNQYKQKQQQHGEKYGKIRADMPIEKKRELSHRCIEFWIKRGLTEEEARIKISENQARGKAWYIKKYGEKIGIKKWKERIDRWQKTFVANNDMNLVNQKRKNNASVGGYNLKNINCLKLDCLYFYLLEFKFDDETFIKYGLTKHDSIIKRWGTKLKHDYKILLFQKLDPKTAVELETKIKLQLKEIHYRPKNLKTTEAILTENLDKINIIIKEYI